MCNGLFPRPLAWHLSHDVIAAAIRQILGALSHRLTPVFPPGTTIPMDAVERIPDMIAFAQNITLDQTIAWLEAHWMGD